MKIRNELPSCAFKVNGTFIEDMVEGYHTLNAVEGKNTLEKELFMAEANVRSGSIYLNSRYPAREIEIEYFIEGTGWEDLQTKFTKLMGVLDKENAEIIFNGESDKYITGSFIVGSEIETTTITRSGKFTIVCPDPFKYSVEEFTVQAEEDDFYVINYDGTYKTYPTLVASFPATYDADGNNTNTSECGYIGYRTQWGAILQFGDPNETDLADVIYPATVPINKTFKTTTGTTNAPWTLNDSQVLTGTQVGTIATNTSSKYMYPSAYSTGTGYHGPSLCCKPINETEPIGKNFNLSWKQKFTATKSQFGGCEILAWNNNNGTRTLIGGVRIIKTTKDTKCKIDLYCGSLTSTRNFTVECSKIGNGSMEKTENNVAFSVAGKTLNLVNDAITDLLANEVTFHFMRNGTKTAIGSNFVYNCKLQRFSFKNKEDIENTFMPGDVLTVNTQDAGVYLDDGSATISAQYLGALGNDWETFCLIPGANGIAADYSDFTTTPPVFELRYRKRYL